MRKTWQTRSFLGFTWAGISSIFRKEIIQLMRDPYLVGFIIALPVIQLMVTGLAVTRDLGDMPTIVTNYDRRNGSYEILKDFDQDPMFEIVWAPVEEETLKRRIRDGKYRAGIIIPPDFSEKLLRGDTTATVNMIVDGTQGNIAKTLVTAAKKVVVDFNRKVLTENSLQPVVGAGGVDVQAKVLYNPDMKTSYFLVPAILAIVMHMLTILFTSFAIVRERESGTLEQLMVTPLRTTDLMLGKILPYAFIGFLDMILTLGVMIYFFNISVTGSFWFLGVASIIFILTSLGMGLLISTISRTQVQAIQLTTGIFLPSLLLTGFVFPLEPMPWGIKIISYSLPLTYYMEVIRGVVIKGVGPSELYPQVSAILLMAVILLGFSIVRFKKQVS